MNFKIINFTKENNFKKITDEWLLYKKYTIKESTYYRYKYVINKYINSEIGFLTIKQLKKYDFNKFVSKFVNLSNSSKNLIIIVLKSILRYAERKYDLELKIDLIQLPKETNTDIKIFSDKEKDILYNYCISSNNPKNLGILLGLYAGLRIGEISALQWKDVNLTNNEIYISKTLQRITSVENKTKIIIDSPKSYSSRRTVLINKKLHNLLYKFYIEYNPNPNAYILTNKEDKFVEPRCLDSYYKRILKKLNLPNYNFHVLRHTFATNCINKQMNYKLLSKILGHSSVNITLNKYVHPSLEDAKEFLEKI